MREKVRYALCSSTKDGGLVSKKAHREESLLGRRAYVYRDMRNNSFQLVQNISRLYSFMKELRGVVQVEVKECSRVLRRRFTTGPKAMWTFWRSTLWNKHTYTRTKTEKGVGSGWIGIIMRYITLVKADFYMSLNAKASRETFPTRHMTPILAQSSDESCRVSYLRLSDIDIGPKDTRQT
jgi:hypothetical protein